MKTFLVIFSLLLVFASVGCVAVSEMLTPARIDGRAKAYVIDRGADPNNYKGYPNLAMSNQLMKDIRAGHLKTMQEFEQAMDRENLEHGLVFDIASADNKAAIQREESLFGERGLLSTILPMLGLSAATGVLGLMRKRPGDVTKEELESALASAGGKTVEELSAKQKQLVQVVQGVNAFFSTLPKDDPNRATLKTALSLTQDTDTQVAVAAIKKELNL